MPHVREATKRQMDKMKDTIYIIGAGAVGKALAVALAGDHKKAVLLRGSVDQQPAHTEKTQVLREDVVQEADVEVSTISNFAELDGIIVLTNKSYGNAELAARLKGKTGSSPIVILQNGLGIEQVFADNGFPEIYRCVLFVTSQLTEDNRVSFKPVAVSPIGAITNSTTTTDAVVKQLDSPGFRFRAENDIQPIIWRKAIINSVFNSVCPLLETDNGIFHRDAGALAIAERVIAECIAIAQEKGISLNAGEVKENLLLISKSSDGQPISTLQDIRNKRRTEIETLNFEIARIAKTLGKENTVQETALLGELTRLKSDLNR